jgi:hypothetical protein
MTLQSLSDVEALHLSQKFNLSQRFKIVLLQKLFETVREKEKKLQYLMGGGVVVCVWLFCVCCAGVCWWCVIL